MKIGFGTDRKEDGIKIEGHVGTWYVIDADVYKGQAVYLLEHEKYGDEAAGLIVDEDGDIIAEDVYNGFSDLDDWYDIECLTKNDMWNILEEYMGVPYRALELITHINGYTEDTMNDILFATTGYRNFEQAQEEYGYDLHEFC